MAPPASACSHAVLRPHSTSLLALLPSPFSHPQRWGVSKAYPTPLRRAFRSSTRTISTPRASSQPPQGGGRGDEDEERSTSPIDTSLILSDDLGYLWKLAAGSVGGASLIKYGSVFLPDITRPNLTQALLMISLPVLVAVAILVRESSTASEDEDLI
ncbi:uncharacterized protein LOC141812345 [Curcuma longa]|uniref:uncharacterized protein LOC141812345 n=1 Tax=Curcuma longa TaxID=136217 RepID=UPI003D9E77C0